MGASISSFLFLSCFYPFVSHELWCKLRKVYSWETCLYYLLNSSSPSFAKIRRCGKFMTLVEHKSRYMGSHQQSIDSHTLSAKVVRHITREQYKNTASSWGHCSEVCFQLPTSQLQRLHRQYPYSMLNYGLQQMMKTHWPCLLMQVICSVTMPRKILSCITCMVQTSQACIWCSFFDIKRVRLLSDK